MFGEGCLDRRPRPALPARRKVRRTRCQRPWLPCLEAGGTPNRKRLTDSQMRALIHALHAELKGAYGRPRRVRERRARGFSACKGWVKGGCATMASMPATNGATR